MEWYVHRDSRTAHAQRAYTYPYSLVQEMATLASQVVFCRPVCLERLWLFAKQ